MRLIKHATKKQNVKKKGKRLHSRLYTAMKSNNRKGVSITDANILTKKKVAKLLRRHRILPTSEIQITYKTIEGIFISGKFYDHTKGSTTMLPFNRDPGALSGYGFDVKNTEITMVILNYFK
jgi:hypothetical protein